MQIFKEEKNIKKKTKKTKALEGENERNSVWGCIKKAVFFDDENQEHNNQLQKKMQIFKKRKL